MHELSFILWEETRLTVFENRALRRMFGSKSNEVRVEWKKTHSEDLHDFFFKFVAICFLGLWLISYNNYPTSHIIDYDNVVGLKRFWKDSCKGKQKEMKLI